MKMACAHCQTEKMAWDWTCSACGGVLCGRCAGKRIDKGDRCPAAARPFSLTA